MKQTKIYIEGMTCVSCESIIADELKLMAGVDRVVVSRKAKTADVWHHSEFDSNQTLAKINSLGYRSALSQDDLASKPKADIWQWLLAIWIIVCFYIVYKMLSYFRFLDWIDINPANVSYGMAFLIGIVASLSTCLAIVGAVVISFGAKYQAKGNFFQANIKPHLLFHLGRLSTFAVLGGILGVVGSWINISLSFMGWFSLVIAIVLAWMGLNILGLVPSLSALGVRMPKKSSAVWNRLKQSEHALAPVILGGFTFFLPCGFTQSMQLLAISSGSFMAGSLTMFFFALGTVPILGGLGMATSRFKNLQAVVFQKVMGLVVIIFAVYTFVSALAMAGISIGLPSNSYVGDTTIDNEIQIVEMAVTFRGYEPNIFTIKQGVPVRWIINGEQITGCTNEIIVPQLGIRQPINKGQNVIEFIPKQTGTLGFSCWMGMVRGRFEVR